MTPYSKLRCFATYRNEQRIIRRYIKEKELYKCGVGNRQQQRTSLMSGRESKRSKNNIT